MNYLVAKLSTDKVAKIWKIATFSCVMLLAAGFAHSQSPEALKLGEAIDDILEAGTQQNFTLTLKSGDYVRLSSTPELPLSFYLPSGDIDLRYLQYLQPVRLRHLRFCGIYLGNTETSHNQRVSEGRTLGGYEEK